MSDSRPLSRQERINNERDQVLSWAAQVALRCDRLNDGHHLKIGSLNFYPSGGKITRDGAKSAEPDKGAEAFIKLVAAERGKLAPLKLKIVS
ncbi:MAG: hypothetical protein EOQ48_14085 [Mesorhizobium sp.]|uniref:hypothetical protein n=1 Tax=Mesorhizobium sp. TaxID=1871066 RepID=UPI000FEA05B8|nr:MAG: hypothetical protein EOQ48_14085 [Mesorhizobium sp.]